MRVLFATGTPAHYMAPPVLGDEQIVCGPDWKDERRADGGWVSLQTPVGQYDLATVVAKLPPTQQPDVVACLVDASWRSLPRNWASFRGPKVLLVADTHHMASPLSGMLHYAASEPFDRIVFLYDRHHLPVFRAAGLQNLHWFPGLTFPHDDAAVRAANREPRAAQIAFVGQAGAFHPRRARLIAALTEHRLPIAHKQLRQREGLNFYGASLIGFNASLNGDLNLRVFEALASGSMLLTDRLAPESGLLSLWQEGRELVTYADAGELLERARHYLDHPAEARAIGQAGAKWFREHFDAAHRRAAFLRLAVEGKTLPEFECPTENSLTIHFPSEPAARKATLAVYENIQELHRTQETVHLSLDLSVPEEFARLCQTLPRVRITREVSLGEQESVDWRVIGASLPAPAEPKGVAHLWCWDFEDAAGEPVRARFASQGLVPGPGGAGTFVRSTVAPAPSADVLPEPEPEIAAEPAVARNGRTLLFYSDEPNPHGVAHYNHAILMALVRAGWTIFSAHPKFESPMLETQRRAGIRHCWTTWNWGQAFVRSMVDCAEPERILEMAKPDLVVFSDCWPISNIAAKHTVIKRNLPFMVVCHSGDLAPGRNFPTSLKVVAMQFAKAKEVVAVAQSSLNVLRGHYGLPADKGRVIVNGRPASYFAPVDPAVRARLRAELKLPKNAVLCFTAARFDVAKGYQYQFEAIKQLVARSRNTPLYFAWAGDGHLLPQFEAAIAQLGLGDSIRLLGLRPNIAEWLGAADIFVLTTMLEAMPLSVLEAMAGGLPVIATAVGGIPEELGDTGKLLPDPNVNPGGTVGQLIETLTKWAGDAALRKKIGLAQKARAERLFREETMVETTLALIEEVAAAAAPGSLVGV